MSLMQNVYLHFKLVLLHSSSLSQLEGCLQPNKAVLYTWADPAGSRKLTWKCGKITEEITPKEVCPLCSSTLNFMYYPILYPLLQVVYLFVCLFFTILLINLGIILIQALCRADSLKSQ